MNFSKVKEWIITKKGRIITAVMLGICIIIAVLAAVFLGFSKENKNIDAENKQETTNTYGLITADGTSEQKNQSQESLQLNQSQQDTQEQEEAGESKEESTSEGGAQSYAVSKNGGQTYILDAASALKVSGSSLTDSSGNPVILRGISTHGLSWFPEYVNEEAFRQLHEQWGINCIRLAMYTAEYNGYCTGDASNRQRLKNLIDDGVRYATENGMYVIIDWHILSDGNPNTYLGESKAFFAEMSQKYAEHDNVLYEICNEPNGGTSWSQIKSYAEEVIPVIRENDSDGVIIVGTPNWSQYVGDAANNPISGYDNIMYALHFYAATHTDSLRNAMISAIEKGLPVFVSEFGICDASGNGGIDEYQANEWVRVMNEYGVSHIAWNLSNKNETSAIISSGCAKTSGWDYDELSDSGKWLYNMLNSDMEYGTWDGGSLGGTDVSENTQEEAGGTQGGSEDTGGSQNTETSGNNSSSGNSLENAPYEMQLQNSWASDGKNYYLYNITVQNPTSAAVTSWSVNIVFDKEMVLTDNWNGEYSLEGKRLTITPKDYNALINAGGTTGNIGFIVHD